LAIKTSGILENLTMKYTLAIPICQQLQDLKQVFAANHSIGVVVVDLEHDKSLDVEVALDHALHELVIAEEHSLEGGFQESDDIVTDVIAEPTREIPQQQFFLKLIADTDVLPQIPVY